MRKKYNTAHRSHVVKTYLSDEEYDAFSTMLNAYHMSQAEYLRRAIFKAKINPIIQVSSVNDEVLAAIGKLTAEYGKIGGNLNQIAKVLNEWHSPYPALAWEVRNALTDLNTLKYEILTKVGDALGNVQAYQL